MQKKVNKIKILLTGGHAGTTALAIVEELIGSEDKKFSWDIYWVGAKTLFKSFPKARSFLLLSFYWKNTKKIYSLDYSLTP